MSFGCRLNITPSPPRKTQISQRVSRGVKRRRIDEGASTIQSSTTTGLVAIIETDLKGDFIKLQNTSDQVRTCIQPILESLTAQT